MSLPYRIAFRYIFSRKSHSAVNVISLVSVAGVTVATAAMVVVLSVFNGFHSLISSRLSELDPPLRVELSDGRAFADADSLAAVLLDLESVGAAEPTVEQRALAIANGYQTPVKVKGVRPDSYHLVASLDESVIDGVPWHDYHPTAPSAVLSVGVANALRAPIGSEELLGLFAPKRLGKINPANPLSAFMSDSVAMGAVFAVNQPEFDTDLIFVPIGMARNLFQYEDEASAIEIAPAEGFDAGQTARDVAAVMGPDFKVMDRMHQHASSFRIVNVEKWMSFLLLAFILVIASFNVISTMALLIIEKEGNAFTLHALGATGGFVRKVYAILGFGITMAGSILGTLFGSLLSLGQQHFGWVKLGGDASALSITAYPMELHLSDLIPVIMITAAVGLVTAAVAARRAD